MPVEEGRPAPDFTLTSDTGDAVKLSSLRGSPVVLYFYPEGRDAHYRFAVAGARGDPGFTGRRSRPRVIHHDTVGVPAPLSATRNNGSNGVFFAAAPGSR